MKLRRPQLLANPASNLDEVDPNRSKEQSMGPVSRTWREQLGHISLGPKFDSDEENLGSGQQNDRYLQWMGDIEEGSSSAPIEQDQQKREGLSEEKETEQEEMLDQLSEGQPLSPLQARD